MTENDLKADIQISIIIPTYNRAHLIIETLDSIKNQAFQSWECLIIDDGSTDNTKNVVESYNKIDERFKYYKRPSNLAKGAPSCRNYGFEMAKGNFIQWFDSDDIMLPQMLLEKYNALSEDIESDFVVSKMGTFTDRKFYEFKNYPTWSANPINDYLLYRVYFLTPGPLFRKSYLKKQGLLFDTKLVKHQEWEFYSRLVITNAKPLFLDTFHCVRRMHDESILSTTNKLEPKVRDKNKFNAVIALNINTHGKFRKMLIRLFYKRILKAAFDSLIKLDLAYCYFFANTMLRLLIIK